MSRRKLSRRQFVAATALSSAALITAPYVRGDIASHTLRATPQRVCDCAAVGRRAQLMWNRPGASVDEFGAETIV